MSTDPKISDALEDVNHSPTPWIVREVHYEGELPRILIQRFRGDGMGYETIAMPYGQSHHRHNAAFIVRAVNAHDELVAALKEAYTVLAFAFNRIHLLPRSRDTELASDIEKVRARIEAALAKTGAP